METVTLSLVRGFANQFDGKTLETRTRKRPFSFRIAPEGFEYTPYSTRAPRMHRWEKIAKVIARYNQTGSLRPEDYKEIDVNASYLLTLVGAYLDSRRPAQAVKSRTGRARRRR